MSSMPISASRLRAAELNDCTKMIKYPTLDLTSPERMNALDAYQEVYADAVPRHCVFCGEFPKIFYFGGCPDHMLCQSCHEDEKHFKTRKGIKTCSQAGCCAPIPDITPVPMNKLNSMRENFTKAMQLDMHAAEVDDTKAKFDKEKLAAAERKVKDLERQCAALNDTEEEEEEGEEEDQRSTGTITGKKRKMTAEAIASMVAKRKATMDDNKAKIQRKLEEGEQAIAQLEHMRGKISELEREAEILKQQLMQQQQQQ